jgi:hypothetical protein
MTNRPQSLSNNDPISLNDRRNRSKDVFRGGRDDLKLIHHVVDVDDERGRAFVFL